MIPYRMYINLKLEVKYYHKNAFISILFKYDSSEIHTREYLTPNKSINIHKTINSNVI